MNWMAARIFRTALRRAPAVATAAFAASALAGCTFGDESVRAQPDAGNWFDPNCVPVECLFQCCHGWNWKPEPSLRGGNVPGFECEEIRKRNSTYSEYIVLMRDTQNYCTDVLASFETGSCYVINPLDVVKEFRPDGQVVYAGLSFSVCPPRGQMAACPIEDVELIPQE
jgi:hypothetical protein